MTKTCPQCMANLGYMERITGYYCINCNSIFIDEPSEWDFYTTDYSQFNK